MIPTAPAASRAAPYATRVYRAGEWIRCPSPVTRRENDRRSSIRPGPDRRAPRALTAQPTCMDMHGVVPPGSEVEMRVWGVEPPPALALPHALHKNCPGCSMLLEIQTRPAAAPASAA